ncbi:hypothetical protein E2C01_097115 [Portunus trituberculatus]|uniref:Uncharacterized protein n=1 Tax=Portunus trituberculatus TaxID=210409 RepID=A0A5B7JXG6_PORTR|nr:hypothetical protein [Portunus trituberculatus]
MQARAAKVSHPPCCQDSAGRRPPYGYSLRPPSHPTHPPIQLPASRVKTEAARLTKQNIMFRRYTVRRIFAVFCVLVVEEQ